MSSQFIAKEIVVQTSGELNQPVQFRLDKKEYRIVEVIESWPDYGFGRSVTGRKRWWQRHHRNYFRVVTDTGELYEIYYDRGVNNKHPEFRKWFVSRKIIK